MLHALIMAGGGGTRFWPMSRSHRPKQFLTLTGDDTLLQESFARLEGQVAAARTWVITSTQHRGLVAEQLPPVPNDHIVGEPCGRDTAPCIGLGAVLIARQDDDATMIVTPSDHVIEPEQEFRRAVQVAVQIAGENPSALVTFGIMPTYPATGYGYIHRGPEAAVRQGVPIYQVKTFREKPAFTVAEEYLATGEYFWNSGIFIWKARTILAALEQNQPDMFAALQRIADAWETPRRESVFAKEYETLTRISIDFAVMETAKEVLVVQAPYQWDDAGSWRAVERLHPQDAGDNTVLARHAGLKTAGCIIVGDAGKLITTVGVADLLIVQDGDVVLVADKREEEAVKQLVELLKQKGLEKYL